jgi:O-antigen/teichoic acid export membrane protein
MKLRRSSITSVIVAVIGFASAILSLPSMNYILTILSFAIFVLSALSIILGEMEANEDAKKTKEQIDNAVRHGSEIHLLDNLHRIGKS